MKGKISNIDLQDYFVGQYSLRILIFFAFADYIRKVIYTETL